MSPREGLLHAAALLANALSQLLFGFGEVFLRSISQQSTIPTAQRSLAAICICPASARAEWRTLPARSPRFFWIGEGGEAASAAPRADSLH